MLTPSKSTSVGQVSKNTATTPLKPGLVSTSHKEEKCGLNAAPLPSKSTLTMPPPPPPTAVKRVAPAITTSQATSVTTMNDEEVTCCFVSPSFLVVWVTCHVLHVLVLVAHVVEVFSLVCMHVILNWCFFFPYSWHSNYTKN
jgi:hypothetical protein